MPLWNDFSVNPTANYGKMRINDWGVMVKGHGYLRENHGLTKLHIASFLTFLLLLGCYGVFAQNNLSVAYLNTQSVPNFINICGNPDTVAVTIRTDGADQGVRRNIEASLQLFRGVELVQLLPGTSPGVTINTNFNPNSPVFRLPDLSPGGLSSVTITFSIKATCDFVDTLKANDRLRVFDLWRFKYDLGANVALTETDNNVEYRDAFAVPFFTVEIQPHVGAARVGQCFERSIKITNTALKGFVGSLVYENVQEIGADIEEITANGIVIPFTQTSLSPNLVKITAVLGDNIFSLNTNAVGGNGDGDGFFDPSEVLILKERVCIQSCYLPMNSSHSVSWGCDNEVCDVASAVDFINIGQGNANLIVQTTGTGMLDDAGYCSTGFSTVKFTNTGAELDFGFGAMIDLALGIGLGSNFQLTQNAYTINRLRIGGVDLTIPNSLNALDEHPQFTTDPDGPGGLADVDGDGFFDDLPIQQSLSITAFFEFDCSIAQGLTDSCFNSFSTNFNARLDYTNSCDERLTRLESSYYRPTNANSGFENFTSPDAFLDTDIFTLQHIETRSIRAFDETCNGAKQLIVTVVLPQGVQPVLNQTFLIKNGVSNFSLVSSNIQNDTLRLVYNAGLTPFLSGAYEIRLAFEADCTAELGPTTFPLTFEYYCGDCDCRHLWYCGDLEGPWLHALNPPCPPDVPVDCQKGLQTTDFEVNRTTFGFLDRNYTTPYPAESANKKVAIPCDSVEMVITNVVGKTDLTDSIGMVVYYRNPDNTTASEPVFLFGSGTVRIVKGGNSTVCALSTTDLVSSTNGGEKTMRFDLHRCLTDLGLTLNPGDSVIFTGNFSVNAAGPLPFQFKNVPGLRAYGYALDGGQELWCDQFGDNFIVGKNNTVFDVPSNLDYPKGCATTLLQYRLVTVNNGFRNFFGNEFRASASVDTLRLSFDPAILEAYEDATVDVSIPGHPIFGNNFFPIRPLSDFPDGNYVAYFDTLSFIPPLNDVQNYAFNLRVKLTPNCTTSGGSSVSNNRYRLNSSMFYEDRAYAKNIGAGECSDFKSSNVNQEIVYTNPPRFSFQPVTTPNFILLGDTAVWTVQLCNISFDADAGSSWIGLESPNGAVEVIKMTDISDPQNPLNLSFEEFGAAGLNYFAFGDALVKASGRPAFDCNTVQIKAIVKRCGNSQLTAIAGWDCTPNNNLDWSPELNAPCQKLQIPLTVSTRDPFLEAAILDQPADSAGVCDTATVSIILRNNDLGAVFDVQTEFSIPATGATFVPGSVEIAYPSGAAFKPVLGEPTFTGVTAQGKTYQFNGFNLLDSFLFNEGLKGFNPVNPTDSNQMVIRFKFVTDCEFLSGSLAYFDFQGTKGCGEPSNFEAGETLPIFFEDGNLPSQLFTIAFNNQSVLVPGRNNGVELHITNISSTLSDNSDKIRLILPTGLTYVGGSTVGRSPASWQPAEPDIQVNGGVTTLTWDMPVGLAENELAILAFELNAGLFDCSTSGVEVEALTLSQRPVFCEISSTNCDIELVTSENGVNLLQLPVGGQLSVTASNATSFCNGSTETVTIATDLGLAAGVFDGRFANMSYFFDANRNGRFDNSETVLASFNESSPSGFQNWSLSHSLDGSANQLCSIGLMIDTVGLPICDTLYFSVETPQILNAGEDENLCIRTTPVNLQIGENPCNAGTYQYLWNAISPASLSDLSDETSPNPTLTIRNNAPVPNELFYVLETARQGCSSTKDTVKITVVSGVVLTADGDQIILKGQSATLLTTLSGGSTPFQFDWQPAQDLNNPTIASPIATPTQTTRYFAMVTDGNGCSDTTSILVIVRDSIHAEVGATTDSICFGGTVQLSATGGDNYRWVAHPGNPPLGILSSSNIANPVFSGGMAGRVYRYNVIVSDAQISSNADTATVSITVLGLPIASAGVDTTICVGGSARLFGSAMGGDGNYLFEWSGNLSGAIQAVSPAISTNYLLTVTDGNSCQSIDSVRVVVSACECEPAVISNISTQNTDCEKAEGSIVIDLVGDAADYDFVWQPDLGQANANNNERIELPFGGYLITISNKGEPDCQIQIPLLVENENGPSATYTSTLASCNTADGSATIAPTDFNYEWQDGFVGHSRSDLRAGFYFVTVTDPSQPKCSNALLLEVREDNPLLANLTVNNQPNCGNRNGSVTITVTGGSGNYTYSWASGTDRNDNLPAGIHTVTVTDLDGGCSLPFIFVLTDNVAAANVVITDTIDVSCIGSNDGRIEFDVVFSPGFSPPADTIISNGIRHFKNGNLPKGNYCMEIRDGNGCVAGGACFTIGEPDPLRVELLSTEICEEPGTIAVEVSGGTSPYRFDWKDMEGTNNPRNRFGLPADSLFEVIVYDANGCSIAAAARLDSCGRCFFFPNSPDDTLFLQAAGCNGDAAFCIPGEYQKLRFIEIYDNGALYRGALTPCDIDSVGIYFLNNLFGQGNLGPYRLDNWSINGNQLNGTFADVTALVTLMNQLDPTGNWTFIPQAMSLSGGDLSNRYGSLEITQLGLGVRSVHPFVKAFPPRGFSIPLNRGLHEIILNDTMRGCSDTLTISVLCTRTDTIRITMPVLGKDTICFDNDELLGAIDRIFDACAPGRRYDFEVLNDSCVIFTGLLEGMDTACITYCDTFGICDTTIVIITVLEPPGPSKIIYDTIVVGQVVRVCCSAADLRLEGDLNSIRNLCPQFSGDEVQFDFDSNTFCVTYTGLAIGLDTACVEFCDDLGNCDTVPFFITVIESEIFYDTIYLSVDTVKICLDTTEMTGRLTGIFNDCPQMSGTQVGVRIDGAHYCFTYFGNAVGVDTLCIVMTDDLGNRKAYVYVVTVITTTPQTICDTIFINQRVEFCLDKSELSAPDEIRFFDNFCPDEGTGLVDFSLDADNNCVEYRGLEIGRDTACFVICDENGVCDTTYFCIEVKEYFESVIANMDCDTTQKLIPVIIEVGENDTLFGRTGCPKIVQAPSVGQAFVNPDCTITYISDATHCATTDRFIYEVCNENGCDTALVKVYILCIDITIFNAVSPNNDGNNDVLFIGGLEDKPDNKLLIFNRWGNLVYEQTNYQNDWEGTWNGKILPDGTYFYVFTVNDNGVERIFRGYLELFR